MHYVQIQCPHCKNQFRDSALRLQNGYSRQCPSCEIVLFFDEDSQNPLVKLTMQRARQVRKKLREAEVSKIVDSASPETFSRSFDGRSRSRTR